MYEIIKSIFVDIDLAFISVVSKFALDDSHVVFVRIFCLIKFK